MSAEDKWPEMPVIYLLQRAKLAGEVFEPTANLSDLDLRGWFGATDS